MYDSSLPYGVVYVMENRDTNRLYIGKHWCKPGVTYSFDEKMFSDGYRGSGIEWAEDRDLMDTPKEDIRLLCILEECETKEQLARAEEYWIDHFSATTSPHFYNRTVKAPGGDMISIMPPARHAEFVQNLKERARRLNFGKHFGKVDGEHNGMYGKKHKPETIEINRQKHLGKRATEETKQKHSQTAKERGIVPPKLDGIKRFTDGKFNIVWRPGDSDAPKGFYSGITKRAPKLCARCHTIIGTVKYRLCVDCRQGDKNV